MYYVVVVWARDLLRTLSLGHPFTPQTDHSAMKQLLTNKMATGEQATGIRDGSKARKRGYAS